MTDHQETKAQLATVARHVKEQMRVGNLRYKLLRPTTQTVASATSIAINSGSVMLTGTTAIRTITGGVAGQLLTLTSTSNGLLLANGGGGNLRLQNVDNANEDATLNANDSIELVYTGTLWLEFGRRSTQGSQGLAGYQGSQGFNGQIGSNGNDGAQGMQGPQGPQGYQGDSGIAGAPAGDGPQGFDGPVGNQGVQGPDGAQGPNG